MIDSWQEYDSCLGHLVSELLKDDPNNKDIIYMRHLLYSWEIRSYGHWYHSHKLIPVTSWQKCTQNLGTRVYEPVTYGAL